jgi:hypothetical protein
MFADNEMRTAEVPLGTVALCWHPLAPPLARAIL